MALKATPKACPADAIHVIDLNAVQKGADKDVTLQAGDVLQVPPSPIRMLPYGFYWLITNVVRVGAGVSLTSL